ncbi:MAG: hypothetical protein FWG02_10345 [Holophagaceae bacterium]|nr:hypothetical protein [Holophagaceae bacterium]
MKMPFLVTPTVLAMCLGLNLYAQAPQQQVPPEQAELEAARKITDIPARLREIQRIKIAYPNSNISYSIDLGIIVTASLTIGDLDSLIVAHNEVVNAAKPQDRFWLLLDSSDILVSHPKMAEFSKPTLLKAVQDYKAKALKILSSKDEMSRPPQSRNYLLPVAYKDAFEVHVAKAHLLNGNGKLAIATLEKHSENSRNAPYYLTLGEALLEQNRTKEALDAFLQVAAEGNLPARERAKDLYLKVHGTFNGFTPTLEKIMETRPFSPPEFKAPKNWKGKTVLAEVFTGSECPPCVAAGFGFDGLKEYYPSQYLVVLKYHLPIPRYDPMMNPATKRRQDYYAIRSTPTAILDGVKPLLASGGRTASFNTFTRAKDEIDTLLTNPVDITIKATATIEGDNVSVNCEFSKIVDKADYHVVLAQTEEEFKGFNGINNHKMVVRDIQTFAPTASASVRFVIPESEELASTYITEWGKTAPPARISGSKWPQQNNTINRTNLKAVVFVQDKESKQVHNAYIVDVK